MLNFSNREIHLVSDYNKSSNKSGQPSLLAFGGVGGLAFTPGFYFNESHKIWEAARELSE